MRVNARKIRRGVGEGNLGCIIWLLVIGVLALAAFKYVPAKIAVSQLNDYAGEQAQFASRRDTSESIKKRILKKADELNLDVDPKGVSVAKGKKGVKVEMKYTLPIEFPGYTYELEVDEKIEKQIFDF